jgi:CRP/FNR family cyclic AMP-dependent transcriptional regulator
MEGEHRMDDKARLLGRVPLFARLKGSELEHVARLADEVEVAAGTRLTTEGRSADEFFVIVDGSVEISRGGSSVRTMGPGDFLGEIALVDNGPRTASATTTAPTRLLVLGHREFHTLLDDYPAVRLCVFQSLAERVRNLDAASGA